MGRFVGPITGIPTHCRTSFLLDGHRVLRLNTDPIPIKEIN